MTEKKQKLKKVEGLDIVFCLPCVLDWNNIHFKSTQKLSHYEGKHL